MKRLRVPVLIGLSLLCLPGCGGNNYSDERFVQETNSQYDQLIERVQSDPSLSDEQKQREIKRIEGERDSFRTYASGDQGQDQ